MRDVVKKLNYSHAAMIDLIIAEPGITQNEIAARFGYTPGWVSQLMSSDGFKEALAGRKAEVVNPVLVASVEENLESVAKMSMGVIREKLEVTKDADLALKAMEISTRAMGYGAKPAGGIQVNGPAQFVVAMPQKSLDNKSWIEQHGPAHVVEG